MTTTAVMTVARKEMRESVRNRWLWAMAGGFAVMAVGLTLVGLPGAQTVGAGGFGRTAASLVALAQLMVPLLGLTIGAQTLATQAENGGLRFVLAHPITRREVLTGTLLGLGAAVWAAVTAGFGSAALVASLAGTATSPVTILALTALAGLLATGTLAVGLAIGAGTSRGASALGLAIGAWLLLVFVGDLGLMGTAMAVRIPVEALFVTAVLNPVEAFRILTVPLFAASLDVLGPAGTFAVDSLGSWAPWVGLVALLGWIVVPLQIAYRRFERRDL